MGSVLLEASRLVLRFKPEPLELKSESVARIYVRAFLSTNDSPVLEPWERTPSFAVDGSKGMVVHETTVDIIKESDGVPEVAMATISSLKFRTCGAHISSINEASVSKLLRQVAVLEVRLANRAPSKIDPLLGTVSLPLQMALGKAGGLCVNTTAAICTAVDLGAGHGNNASSRYLEDGALSTMTVSLTPSNELFQYMAGGTVLNIGNFIAEAVPSKWTTASMPLADNDHPVVFELDLGIQRKVERTKSRVSDGPHMTLGGITAKLQDNGPRDTKSTCNLESMTDRISQVALFMTVRTVVDIIESPDEWALIVSLRPRATSEVTMVASIPAGKLLGLPMVLNTPLHATNSSLDVFWAASEASGDDNSLALGYPTVTIACNTTNLAICSHPAKTQRWKQAAEYLNQGLSFYDCIPPERALRMKTPQDMDNDLANEVKLILSMLSAKYDTLDNHGFGSYDAEPRYCRLKMRLDQHAKSHSVRVRFTPKLQHAICRWLPTQPRDAAAWETWFSECHSHIMYLANTFLAPQDGKHALTPPSHVCLGLARALDSEANCLWATAAAEHKTRLSLAILHSASQEVTASTWFEYAKTVLRSRGAAMAGFDAIHDPLGEACQALDACIAFKTKDATDDEALRLRGAVGFEQGNLCAAEALLDKGRTRENCSLDAALLCVIADACGDGILANRAAAAAACSMIDKGIPLEYGTTTALQHAASYLSAFALTEAATMALSIADRAAVAVKLCNCARLESIIEPRPVAAQRLILQAHLGDDSESSVGLARSAVNICESVATQVALGDTLCRANRVASAIGPYASTLTKHTDFLPHAATSLETSIKHARCLLWTNRNSTALEAYVKAANQLQAASLWLGAGAAALRLGGAACADRYLRLSTIRSPYDSRTYALLSLLHVTTNNNPIEMYVTRALDAAVRLGLDNPGIFRQLGNAFFQLERYPFAEALLRRAIAAESKKGAYDHTVKRLADVVAAQRAKQGDYSSADTPSGADIPSGLS